MVTSVRRRKPRLVVTSPETKSSERNPVLSWWLAALSGSLIVCVGGWVVIGGLVTLAWLTAMSTSVLDALRAGTQIWLLAHGSSARLGELTISLTPLGLTILLGVALAQAAAFAARQAVLAHPVPRELSQGRIVLVTSVVVAASYVVVLTATSMAVGTPQQTAATFVGSSGLALVSSFTGAAIGIGYNPTVGWPQWLQALPQAVLVAVSIVLGSGASAVVVQLLISRSRMQALDAALKMGPLAGLILVLVQLLWAPTIILWGTSYILGAGFRVGQGSMVSLSNTQVGMLPGFPLFGAVPTPATSLSYGWLICGVIAGSLTGIIMIKSCPQARLEFSVLLTGLAGAVSALVVTALCAMARGSLGVDRLSGMGPRIATLLAMVLPLLSLSAMVAGLLLRLIQQKEDKLSQ